MENNYLCDFSENLGYIHSNSNDTRTNSKNIIMPILSDMLSSYFPNVDLIFHYISIKEPIEDVTVMRCAR